MIRGKGGAGEADRDICGLSRPPRVPASAPAPAQCFCSALYYQSISYFQSIDAFDGGPERRAAAEEERLRQLTLATSVKLKGSEHYTSSKINRRSRPVVVFSLKRTEAAFPPACQWGG